MVKFKDNIEVQSMQKWILRSALDISNNSNPNWYGVEHISNDRYGYSSS